MLPNLEAPEDPTLATATEDSTKEATLLTRGGQEVSGLDSIPCEEEDNLLSSTPQESAGKNPVKGVSPVESEPSSCSELMGSPPTKGTDPPAEPSAPVEASEHTPTPTPTQEHWAKVHSSAINVEADTEALTASCGCPFIKPKPLDPLPVKFTGDLRVINDELEIVNFVPAREVSHTGHQVKQLLPEHVSCPPWAALHSHPMGEIQGWSDAPSPTAGHVGADLSDQPMFLPTVTDDSQPSTSGTVQPPTTSSGGATPVPSAPSRGSTAAVALPSVSRSAISFASSSLLCSVGLQDERPHSDVLSTSGCMFSC